MESAFPGQQPAPDRFHHPVQMTGIAVIIVIDLDEGAVAVPFRRVQGGPVELGAVLFPLDDQHRTVVAVDGFLHVDGLGHPDIMVPQGEIVPDRQGFRRMVRITDMSKDRRDRKKMP